MEAIGEGVAALYRVFKALCWLCLIFVPLGLWKAAELVLWLAGHLQWK